VSEMGEKEKKFRRKKEKGGTATLKKTEHENRNYNVGRITWPKKRRLDGYPSEVGGRSYKKNKKANELVNARTRLSNRYFP